MAKKRIKSLFFSIKPAFYTKFACEFPNRLLGGLVYSDIVLCILSFFIKNV